LVEFGFPEGVRAGAACSRDAFIRESRMLRDGILGNIAIALLAFRRRAALAARRIAAANGEIMGLVSLLALWR
jgi:hypothetical protein